MTHDRAWQPLLDRDRTDVPSADGAWTTRRVAERCAPGEPFLWRATFAAIRRDCRFTAMPGVGRVQILAAGVGLRLERAGRAALVAAAPGAVLRFAGAPAAACRLEGGPVEVLNVMFDAERLAPEIDLVHVAGTALRLGCRAETLVVVLEGRVEAAAPEGPIVLGPRDAALASAGAAAALRAADGPALVCTAAFEPRRA